MAALKAVLRKKKLDLSKTCFVVNSHLFLKRERLIWHHGRDTSSATSSHVTEATTAEFLRGPDSYFKAQRHHVVAWYAGQKGLDLWRLG